MIPRRVLVVAAMVCSAAHLLCAERLPIRRFTIADGLPHDVVSSIYSDSRGLLWFATAEGLAHFDGSAFTLLDAPQLRGAIVRDLVESPAGTYWIATSRGLVRFTPARQPEFQVVAGPSNVFTIAAGVHGRVWVSSSEGISVAGGPTAVAIASLPGPVYALTADGDILWMATTKGLFRRSADGTLARFGSRDGFSGDDIRSIARDSGGFIWIGTTTGLCRFRGDPGDGVECFSFADGMSSLWINSILATRDGRIWIATAKGIARSEPGSPRPSFRSFETSHGLPDPEVVSLEEDREGNLWAATESSGVFEIPRSGLVAFTEADGLASDRVSAVGEDHQGNLYVVTSADVLHSFDGRRFHPFRPRFPPSLKYFGWGWNQIVLEARNDDWWIATGEGLFRYPAVGSVAGLASALPRAIYTRANGLGANEVFRLFEDTHGTIWVSIFDERNRLACIDEATGKITIFGARDGVLDSPSAFASDGAGNVWLGLYRGEVVRHRNGRFEPIAQLGPGLVRDMRCDRAGRLLVAAGEGGAAIIPNPEADHPNVRRYSKKDGLPTNQVYSIVEDRFGRVYFGTTHGISRLDPQTGFMRQLTTLDGLPSNFVNVAFEDRTGALWFATLRGIARLMPELEPPRPAPAIWIRGLHVAGVPQPVPALGAQTLGPFRFRSDQNRIEIEFESIGLRAGDRTRYQYRLGGDRDWSAPSEHQGVALANLTSGDYEFEVRALNSDGLVSRTPAGIRFAILPPLWRRWWFQLAIAVALAALVHLYYRARAARLLELERVRIRIASDLHDDIGGSLSRIAVLSEVVRQHAEDNRMALLLSDVADSARAAIESMSDIVWSIDPRRDDVGNLNRRLRECAGEILDAAGITWIFEADPHVERLKLGPRQRRELYLVVKEALTNAVRHAACSVVTLTMNASESILRITVADNGRGFDEASVEVGHGLGSMRSRLTELGGTIHVVSAAGEGTRLEITLPVKKTA